jgi:hypothetical protein
VGHPDDIGAEAEREQQLGCVGDEADDPHPRDCTGTACPRTASLAACPVI